MEGAHVTDIDPIREGTLLYTYCPIRVYFCNCVGSFVWSIQLALDVVISQQDEIANGVVPLDASLVFAPVGIVNF